jgi:hypothetical protein
MKKLISIIALLFSTVVYAQAPVPIPFALGQPITLSWTAPTANADGSKPAQVAGYNVYVASTDAALTALPNTITGAPAPANLLSVGLVLTHTFMSVPVGTYYYAVTAWNCATRPCAESVQSAHIAVVVTAPVGAVKPGPPGNPVAK